MARFTDLGAGTRSKCAIFTSTLEVRSGSIAPDVGVVAYHLPFDERLTLGFNPRLADVLGMSNIEVLGYKDGRPIGMIGTVPSQPFVAFQRQCSELFGGYEQTVPALHEPVACIAMVGAMTDALVHEASARGAEVYVTGQYRHPARGAVAATGIGVIEVGHRRSEAWGLRALAGMLRERWATLTVVLPHNDW